jgi:hypothetical protein
MMTTSEQELIGLALLARRKAHAQHYDIPIEESQRRCKLTDILDNPRFAPYNQNGNAASK